MFLSRKPAWFMASYAMPPVMAPSPITATQWFFRPCRSTFSVKDYESKHYALSISALTHGKVKVHTRSSIQGQCKALH